MDLETEVKLEIYETIGRTTKAPTVEEVAVTLGKPAAEIQAAFHSLAQKRLLFLEPGTSQIRMAPPFSAVETAFRVVVQDKSYFANCIWDALGIAAALHSDADVYTICDDCKTALSLQVRNGAPVPQECIIHFAVPPAHWWDDIVYT
jgi:Alkylmercury lyase